MTERSRTEYSIVNIAASMGGYALNIILSFICRIVFAHELSADYLGVNGLFGNILSMLSLTELGIGTAMIYALYKPVAQKDEKKIAGNFNDSLYDNYIIACNGFGGWGHC